MKHLCKQLAALALVLAIIASFAVLPAQATELKTGFGRKDGTPEEKVKEDLKQTAPFHIYQDLIDELHD